MKIKEVQEVESVRVESGSTQATFLLHFQCYIYYAICLNIRALIGIMINIDCIDISVLLVRSVRDVELVYSCAKLRYRMGISKSSNNALIALIATSGPAFPPSFVDGGQREEQHYLSRT